MVEDSRSDLDGGGGTPDEGQRAGLPTSVQGLVWLGEIEDVGPPRFLLEGYIPEGFATILFGAGGTGKSNLALGWALCAATGTNFCGLEMRKVQAVMYVDYELSGGVQRQRAGQLAAGLGIDLPTNIGYVQPAAGLPGAIDDIGRIGNEIGAELIVIDSTGAAAAGQDMQNERFATSFFRELDRQCRGRTFLLIDHQAKHQARQSDAQKSPYGNVYKFNLARSVIQVGSIGDGVLVLRHQKNNFGSLREPWYLRPTFEDDRITYEAAGQLRAAASPEPSVTQLVVPRPQDRLLEALNGIAVTLGEKESIEVAAAELATLAGVSPEAVGKMLTGLNAAKGRRTSQSRYWVVSRGVAQAANPKRWYELDDS